MQMKEITVLGVDPGTNNCAASVLHICFKPFKFNYLHVGMIQNPVKEIKGRDLKQRCDKFNRELSALKRKHRPTHLIAERFMTRGRGGSTTIEAVSMQLGIMSRMAMAEICFIPASQWKNAVNRITCLDDLYDGTKQLGFTPHELDSALIAMYGACMWADQPYYKALTNIKQFKKILSNA
jgi:Holliday junction resolvasome RuvABC endonuclease subunit